MDRCYNWRECGGWLHLGYKYVMRKGISLEQDYLYEGLLRYPYFGKKEGVVFALMVMRCDMDELSLMKVVLKHPTSVHLCAVGVGMINGEDLNSVGIGYQTFLVMPHCPPYSIVSFQEYIPFISPINSLGVLQHPVVFVHGSPTSQ